MCVGLICSLFIFKNKPSRATFNIIGITISTFYLLATLGVKHHVEKHFQAELTAKSIAFKSLLVMPVGMGNINWYRVAKTDKGLYMHKYSILNDDQIHFEYFPTNDYLLDGLNPKLVDRMKWFAKGFYTIAKDENKIRFYNLQVDMRGTINDGIIKAPTAGYFVIIPHLDDCYDFSSGAHKINKKR